MTCPACGRPEHEGRYFPRAVPTGWLALALLGLALWWVTAPVDLRYYAWPVGEAWGQESVAPVEAPTAVPEVEAQPDVQPGHQTGNDVPPAPASGTPVPPNPTAQLAVVLTTLLGGGGLGFLGGGMAHRRGNRRAAIGWNILLGAAVGLGGALTVTPPFAIPVAAWLILNTVVGGLSGVGAHPVLNKGLREKKT